MAVSKSSKKKSFKRKPKKVESVAVTPTSTEWTNRQKVLMICSRGISYLGRHLASNLVQMMPHVHPEPKLDSKKDLAETMLSIASTRVGTTGVMYFEMRKRRDLYMWLAPSYPNGPTLKFLVVNVHTLQELRLSGNCLRGSRPILVMDASFDESAHMRLVKEVLVRMFSTPDHHPHSQPFVDNALAFKPDVADRIWFRNYQIIESDADKLTEIGPRFCMQLILVTNGFFGEKVLYKNQSYVSPNKLRAEKRKPRYGERTQDKIARELRVGDGKVHSARSAGAIVDDVFV